VPVQIDVPKLRAIDPHPWLCALRFMAMGDQQQGFPRGFEAVLELSLPTWTAALDDVAS